MNSNKMLELIKMLDWSLPRSEQKGAFKELLSVVDASNSDLLIQPMLKGTWYNAVLLTKAIGYSKNERALKSLIWLLQDLSWPGTYQAILILKKVDKSVLIPLLESAISEAFQSNDFMWLAGIKQFLFIAQIYKLDFVNSDIHDLLLFADF